MPRDFLLRGFQADLDRFYRRVIFPTLSELSPHEAVKEGEFSSLDEYLDNAEKQTFNLVVYEARRCFTLTLAAIFERQLRMWVQAHVPEVDKAKVSKLSFQTLLKQTAADCVIDLKSAAVGDTIDELYLLANAVRHGDGRSADGLRNLAPQLFQSERILLADNDFARYMRALTRFWGLADHEPGAVIDVPY